MRKKKNRNITILSILVIFIGIGFAYLSANLSINGQSLFKKVEWSIYLDNIVEIGDSTNSGTATINQDQDTINFSTTLNTPGDIYSFTFDVVNDGTVDAVLESIEIDDSDLPDFMEVTAKYSDGEVISPTEGINIGDLLSKQNSEKILVIVRYKEDISVDDLPSEAGTTNMSITLNYAQHKRSDNALVKVYYNHNFIYSSTEQDNYTTSEGHIEITLNDNDEYEFEITPSSNDATFNVDSGLYLRPDSLYDFPPAGKYLINIDDLNRGTLGSYKDYYSENITGEKVIVYAYYEDSGNMVQIKPETENLLVTIPYQKKIYIAVRILNGSGNTYTFKNAGISLTEVVQHNQNETVEKEFENDLSCETYTGSEWYTEKALTNQVLNHKNLKNNQILYANTLKDEHCG